MLLNDALGYRQAEAKAPPAVRALGGRVVALGKRAVDPAISSGDSPMLVSTTATATVWAARLNPRRHGIVPFSGVNLTAFFSRFQNTLLQAARRPQPMTEGEAIRN